MGMCRDVGMHQHGVRAKCSPGACAPDAPSQPWHWGGHEMIVSMVSAELWVLQLPLPVPPQV